jgi:hypothetical protein
MRIGIAPLVTIPATEGGGVMPLVPRDGTPWSIVSTDPRFEAMGQALVLLESRPEDEAAHAAYGFAPLTRDLTDLTTLWAQRRNGDGTAPARRGAVAALRAAKTSQARHVAHMRMIDAVTEGREGVRVLRRATDEIVRREVALIEASYFPSRDDPGIHAAIIASDGFSGTAGDNIDGRVMDAAGGGAADTWGKCGYAGGGSGAQIVAGNKANRTSDNTIIYDATASNIADQWSSILIVGSVSTAMRGAACRINPAGGDRGYAADTGYGGGTPRLMKMTSGGYSFFGSGGSVAAGDTEMLEMEGTTGTAVVNGVDQVSGTDSAIATGVGGAEWFWAGEIDNFVWGDLASATIFPTTQLLLGAGG